MQSPVITADRGIDPPRTSTLGNDDTHPRAGAMSVAGEAVLEFLGPLLRGRDLGR